MKKRIGKKGNRTLGHNGNISFVLEMRMRKCHLFRANVHQGVPFETQGDTFALTMS